MAIRTVKNETGTTVWSQERAARDQVLRPCSDHEPARCVVLGGVVVLAEPGVVVDGPRQPAANRVELEFLIAPDTWRDRIRAAA